MNRIQAVDAANVIMHIRPDWQQAGIISVLLQLDLTFPAAILHSVKVAANPNSRNPGAITNTPQTVERQPTVDPAARLAIVGSCQHCDERGYLANGAICHHEPPEAAAERAHRGANLARAELLRVLTAPASQVDRRRPTREPYLPADLTAETRTRHETNQPEQETT